VEGKGKEEGKEGGEGKGGEMSRFLDLPTWQPYLELGGHHGLQSGEQSTY